MQCTFVLQNAEKNGVLLSGKPRRREKKCLKIKLHLSNLGTRLVKGIVLFCCEVCMCIHSTLTLTHWLKTLFRFSPSHKVWWLTQYLSVLWIHQFWTFFFFPFYAVFGNKKRDYNFTCEGIPSVVMFWRKKKEFLQKMKFCKKTIMSVSM